jgi:hypothetical protein
LKVLAEALRIGVAHVGKAVAEALIVRARQRILSLQVDVIAQHDERALPILGVDASRRVGQYQSANAHPSEHTRRKRNLGRRVAFIKMHASLHYGDRHVARLADYQLSRVSDGSRTRKRWNLRVGDADGFAQVIGKRPQA